MLISSRHGMKDWLSLTRVFNESTAPFMAVSAISVSESL